MTNDRWNACGNSKKMTINETGVGLLIHGRWLPILRFHFFLYHLDLLKHFLLQKHVQSKRDSNTDAFPGNWQNF